MTSTKQYYNKDKYKVKNCIANDIESVLNHDKAEKEKKDLLKQKHNLLSERKNRIKESVERLSRPKQYVSIDKERINSSSKRQERQHRKKGAESPFMLNHDRSFQEIIDLNYKMYRERKNNKSPAVFVRNKSALELMMLNQTDNLKAVRRQLHGKRYEF